MLSTTLIRYFRPSASTPVTSPEAEMDVAHALQSPRKFTSVRARPSERESLLQRYSIYFLLIMCPDQLQGPTDPRDLVVN
ncbi:hypothetical protein EVAR_61123_1 [Eumeta japonica]|uniref:Uncharacterized protein n=1 Tax=Eumeta variegata TaxID=151549 RepID=A0A4C1ZH35_EUMVA|nr:hypothetical protein EVAR_61123_1 [Eumeta japonica]